MSAFDRIFEAAAEARSAGVRQTADRPSNRRCAEESGSMPLAVVRAEHITVRESAAGEAFRHFTGFASVYNRGYEMWDWYGPYTEQVVSGAGAESLARSDLDVPFVLAHDSLRRIARTTNGSLLVDERTETLKGEEVEGLYVEAPALDTRDVDVAYIVPKLDSGLVDEMSFRFRIDVGRWSSDWTEYHIEKFDIHRGDVAIVGYGANPHTSGSGLRGALEFPPLTELTEARLRQLENDLHAERKRRGDDAAPPVERAGGMTFDQLVDLDRRSLISPVD